MKDVTEQVVFVEVEWKARPNTGITEIDITELGVKSKKEFNLLGIAEQNRRINEWLKEYEEKIYAKLQNWEIKQ